MGGVLAQAERVDWGSEVLDISVGSWEGDKNTLQLEDPPEGSPP